MKIHADLSRRAVVKSPELPWVPSPLPGVDRRMLERDGGEIAWSFEVGERVWTSPAVVDGAVYFGSHDGHIYSISGG